MFSKIFKITLFALIVASLFWLKSTNDFMHITIGKYIIDTSLFNIIILSLIIFIPLWIIIALLTTITDAMKRKSYISSIASLVKIFNSKEEKDVLLDLILHNTKTKDLQKIKDLKILIIKRKYDKALQLAKKIKIHPDLEHIVKRYICIAYKNKKDFPNFIINAKQAIDIRKHNFWFFKELADYYLKDNEPININYLRSVLREINFSGHEEERKIYTSAINYKYTQTLLNKDSKNDAKNLAKDIINTYQDFLPMYNILGKIYKESSSNFDKYLIQAWKVSPSYSTIDLWLKFEDEKTCEKTLKDAIAKQPNTDMNNLLKAALLIKRKMYLEAYDILTSVPDTSEEKVLVQLELMYKEQDYSKVNTLVDHLYSKYLKKSWWYDYI